MDRHSKALTLTYEEKLDCVAALKCSRVSRPVKRKQSYWPDLRNVFVILAYF